MPLNLILNTRGLCIIQAAILFPFFNTEIRHISCFSQITRADCTVKWPHMFISDGGSVKRVRWRLPDVIICLVSLCLRYSDMIVPPLARQGGDCVHIVSVTRRTRETDTMCTQSPPCLARGGTIISE